MRVTLRGRDNIIHAELDLDAAIVADTDVLLRNDNYYVMRCLVPEFGVLYEEILQPWNITGIKVKEAL